MKITGISRMTVLTKNETKSKDGQNTYYKLGVMCLDDVGMISCNEAVYKNVEAGNIYDFETTYNDQYKSFSVSNCRPLKG